MASKRIPVFAQLRSQRRDGPFSHALLLMANAISLSFPAEQPPEADQFLLQRQRQPGPWRLAGGSERHPAGRGELKRTCPNRAGWLEEVREEIGRRVVGPVAPVRGWGEGGEVVVERLPGDESAEILVVGRETLTSLKYVYWSVEEKA